MLCVIFCLFLLICRGIISADEDYFKRSILRELEEKNGQLSYEVDFKQIFMYIKPELKKKDFVAIIKSKHNYKLNSGQQTETQTALNLTYKYLYLDGKELYGYSSNFSYCYSCPMTDSSLGFFNKFWGSEQIYSKNFTYYKTIGPTLLLEVLHDRYDMDKESVKCVDREDKSKKNARKCMITFNDTIKLEYDFFDREEHTMFPIMISKFVKNKTSSDWNLQSKFVFRSFEPLFGGESIVDLRLPIGFGCIRVNSKNYPTISTNYGTKFELEQNVTFSYKKRVVEDKAGFKSINWQGNQTRFYSNKMNVDLSESINEAETIGEIENVSIKAIYNTKTHILISLNLKNDTCSTFNLTSDESLNWYYIQNTFVKRAELYYAKTSTSQQNDESFYANHNGTYSYLGEYTLGDIPCSVFEAAFYYYRSSAMSTDNTSTIDQYAGLENQNKLPHAVSVYATHYYPIKKNYWSEASEYIVPKRIEMRIYDRLASFYKKKIGELSIDFKTFSPNKEHEKYDIRKCKIHSPKYV